jgi:hypothetical protein
MASHKFFREGYPPSTGAESPSTFTRAGDFDFDLNSVSFDELSRISLLGPERAKALIESRPFTDWRHLPDFNDAVIEDLKRGGMRIRKPRRKQ